MEEEQRSKAAAIAGQVKMEPQWLLCRESIRGPAHERKDQPNQDWSAVWRCDIESVAGSCILAVADGHGSPKCYRSDVGSKLAVQAAHGALFAFGTEHQLSDLVSLYHEARQRMPHEIVSRWIELVEQNIEEVPLPVNSEAQDTDTDEMSGHRKLLPYGSTLLAVLITPRYILGLQIGDGDVLIVDSDLKVHRPVNVEQSLSMNEVTSLCQPTAAQLFDFCFVPLSEASTYQALPLLVMLTTDGYSNSFQTDEGFLMAASDIARTALDKGWTAITDAMPTWLYETTKEGIQDDISVAAAFSVPASQRVRDAMSQGPLIPADNEPTQPNDLSSPIEVTIHDSGD